MMKGSFNRASLVACTFSLLALGAWASPAYGAAPTHIFDAVHSLTGGCTVSTADPVPDPPRVKSPQEQEVAECETGTHPSESFIHPEGITVDSYGNVYVAVAGPVGAEKNRVDIFNSDSLFVSEVSLPGPVEVKTVAVDSEGYLYVFLQTSTAGKLERFAPDAGYDPATGKIAYSGLPAIVDETGSVFASLAVNPEDDHLFVNFGGPSGTRAAIVEFGSGSVGNPLLDDEVAEVSQSGFGSAGGLAIDAVRGRIYANDQEPEHFPETGRRIIRVFNLAAPHELIETLDGSSTPEGTFVRCNGVPENCSRWLSIAVDETTGNLFAYDQEGLKEIYELSETGQYLSSIDHDLQPQPLCCGVAVDNGENSPNRGFVWATDRPSGIGHAYAFSPTETDLPEIEAISFSEVSEGEALLEAKINPNQADTTYRFEFVSEQQFETSGFSGARTAGSGQIAAGKLAVRAFAEATGLSPGTSYVFRVVAENEVGPDEGLGEFSTYPADRREPCPNDAVRKGPSASLPDCRAYELVTPPDTGARSPLGLGPTQNVTFPTLPASPAGDRVSFRIENGLIPGLEATGSLAGDPYLSTRGASGWTTEAVGGNGTEALVAAAGGRSPDQTYSAWRAEGPGPAVIGGVASVYLRYPDGHSELLGKGSLGTDPQAGARLITDGGRHVIFTSSVRLEPAAPKAGEVAVYDRDVEGITHVASLLPDGGTPVGSILCKGSSLDGRGIAFEVNLSGVQTLYLRRDNLATYEIGDNLTFEGVAEGGGRIFYLQGGNLKAFDADSAKTISFAGGGHVTVVNISADGSSAFFVSPDKLTSNSNPLGDHAIPGEENLYRSQEGAISFVATVSNRDVEGEGSSFKHDGLGLWLQAVTENGSTAAKDPSRSTEDGRTLLFQSDADLTHYSEEGTRQVYRYASTGELTCVSCNPTGAPPSGDATLQNVLDAGDQPSPNSQYDLVENLSTSGSRAFFQSPDPLVAADTDRLQDVYEWEAQGVGSCGLAAGCLHLISSGRSEVPNYLYAASASGDDIFFSTSDRLVSADKEAIPSIYDARVGGGFAEPAPEVECEGEGCRPQLAPAPALSTPGTANGESGNVVRKRCPKGKRKVTRHGKVRCANKHKHRRHHHRHSSKAGKGGRK